MMWIEDQFQTDPSDAFPIDHYNPMNMKTPDGSGWMDFDSYPEGIQGWRERITSPTYKPQAPRVYAKTTTVSELVHVYAPSSENDVTNYIMVTCIVANSALKRGTVSVPNPPSGGSSVSTYLTEIPGLPGGPLQTTHPVYIKLIPAWRTNNRPGYTARTPRRSVQHGNGNPNSSAAGEATYLFNGAEGRKASYHSTTDDRESWIMVPSNEVTWQAADGSGPGNYNGFSNEMVEDSRIWASETRRDRVIANAAELMGGVAARLDIDKPEQHWTFNYNDPQRHDCPSKLRHTTINGRPVWEIYSAQWREAKLAERKRMAGEAPSEPSTPPTPKPIYADAVTVWMGDDLKKTTPSDHSFTTKVDGEDVKVKVWGAEREYAVVKSTPRYLGPDIKGKRVGGNVVVGEDFVGSYVCAVGSTRWIVTKYGSWILAARCTPRVAVRES